MRAEAHSKAKNTGDCSLFQYSFPGMARKPSRTTFQVLASSTHRLGSERRENGEEGEQGDGVAASPQSAVLFFERGTRLELALQVPIHHPGREEFQRREEAADFGHVDDSFLTLNAAHHRRRDLIGRDDAADILDGAGSGAGQDMIAERGGDNSGAHL